MSSAIPTQSIPTEISGKPALAGIRVVDLTQFESGTACTEMLAFLGAEVIKIEPPIRGEVGRYNTATEKTAPGQDSAFFIVMNANKHSVTLDLKQEDGRALLRRLIERSDVFVENFAPGTIERLGFGYDAVKAINPRMIYAQIKGFPDNGPFAGLNAFDVIAQAAGGSTSITGSADGPPVTPGIHAGDTGTGMHCLVGILAALFQRQATGQGQRVVISMQEAIISQARASYVGQIVKGKAVSRTINGAWANGAVSGLFKCQGDGQNDYCFISLRIDTRADKGGADAHWQTMLRVMGREDLRDDPRFSTPEARGKQIASVNELITGWTSRHDKHEVMRLLGEAGLLASAVLDTDDLFHDPTLNQRGTFATIEHPQRGPVKIPGWPVQMSGSSVPIACSPTLGGDNQRVYGQLLGVDPDTLSDLRARKVI